MIIPAPVADICSSRPAVKIANGNCATTGKIQDIGDPANRERNAPSESSRNAEEKDDWTTNTRAVRNHERGVLPEVAATARTAADQPEDAI